MEGRILGVYIPVPPLLGCALLGKKSNCLGLFPHLYSGDSSGTCIIGLSEN